MAMGWPALYRFSEICPLQHAGNPYALRRSSMRSAAVILLPIQVELNSTRVVRVENLEDLLLVGARVALISSIQSWSSSVLAGRIADHAGKIADQEDNLMTELLELP